MRFQQVVDSLSHLIPTEESEDQHRSDPNWYEFDDIYEFFQKSRSGDIPLYASVPGFFLYGIFVPNQMLASPDYEIDVMDWNFSHIVQYGFSYSPRSSAPRVELEDSLSTGSYVLDSGLNPIFLRTFEGCSERSSYMELNQRISHILNVHWIQNQQAWCEFNDRGELDNIIRFKETEDLKIATVRGRQLEELLFIYDATLIRVFDVNRPHLFYPNSDSTENPEYPTIDDDIFCRRVLSRDEFGTPCYSYIRGFQLIRSAEKRESVWARITGSEPRHYESFIIQDWRNNCVSEWTSDPQQLGNYFVDSGLPFETSPAFFHSDVMLKYRQDPTRFQVSLGWMHCRGSWSIRYSQAEDGQIWAFIKDLATLPHQEQLHWKAYNEEPTMGLTDEDYRQQILGEFTDHYNPLRSLRDCLLGFPTKDDGGNKVVLWRFRSLPTTRDLNSLNYMFTNSQLEWETQILRLAHIIIEGFEKGAIERCARYAGCSDKALGSIRQLDRLLERHDCTVRAAIIEPLDEVQNIRSKAVAHAGKLTPPSNPRDEFRRILSDCDKSMRELARLIRHK